MFTRTKEATEAVSTAATAVHELASDARTALSDVKDQVTASAAFLPAAVVGVGIVAVIALVVALVAVSRD